jgi:bombesin receptor subtype-3
MEGILEQVMDNSTNSTDQDYTPYERRIETYLVPILFSIIFVGGIVGNWTVCVIFIRHSSMRNVPNTYVSSLFCCRD